MRVAKTAIAAFGDQSAIADVRQIGQQCFIVLVEDLRPRRNLEDDVIAARAGAIASHAVTAAARLEMLLIAIVDQGVEALDALRNYVAAASAIAAIRPAELNELFAPKRHTAVSAGAGRDIDLRLIEKFHDL